METRSPFFTPETHTQDALYSHTIQCVGAETKAQDKIVQIAHSAQTLWERYTALGDAHCKIHFHAIRVIITVPYDSGPLQDPAAGLAQYTEVKKVPWYQKLEKGKFPEFCQILYLMPGIAFHCYYHPLENKYCSFKNCRER